MTSVSRRCVGQRWWPRTAYAASISKNNFRC